MDELRGVAALRWLQSCTVPGVKVHPALTARAESGAGEGFVVGAPVRSGELLLRIPRALHLTSDAAEAALALVLRAPHFELPSAAASLAGLLCVMVLQPAHSVPSVFWRGFLATLPVQADFATFPQTWNADWLAYLGDARLSSTILADHATWKTEYAELQAVWDGAVTAQASKPVDLEPMPGARCAAAAALDQAHSTLSSLVLPDRVPTWEQYRHCRACIATRVFLDGLDVDPTFVVPGVEHMLGLALVPVSDMLNHDTSSAGCSATVDWQSRPERVYEVRAARALAAGDGVTISYGVRGSSDLLSTYGFVLPDCHPHESMLLPRPSGDVGQFARRHPKKDTLPKAADAMVGADEHWEKRLEWWDFLGLPDELEVPCSASGVLEFLAAARAACALPAEVTARPGALESRRPVSLSSEVAACRLALWMCQSHLAELQAAPAAPAPTMPACVVQMTAAYRQSKASALRTTTPWINALCTVACALHELAPVPREHLVASKTQLLQPLDALMACDQQGFSGQHAVQCLATYVQQLLRLALPPDA